MPYNTKAAIYTPSSVTIEASAMFPVERDAEGGEIQVMQSVETQGRTIDEAVAIALGQLGQRREDVDIEVLRPGTQGVLGVGAEPALVRVTVRGAPAPGYNPAAAPQPYTGQPNYGVRPAPDYGNAGPRPEYGAGGGRPDYGGGYGAGRGDYQQRPPQRGGYTPGPRNPSYGAGPGAGRGDYQQRPPQRGGYPQPGYGGGYNAPPPNYGGGYGAPPAYGGGGGYGSYAPPAPPPMPVVQQPPMPPAFSPEAEQLALEGRDIITNLMRRMRIPAQANVEYTGVAHDAPDSDDSDNTVVIINLAGSQDLGMLIGRRGESLTDLQFVFNLMMNKRTRQWGKVMLDVEGYRTRRKEQLVNLAKRMAEQVGTHRQPVTLEPMPAYERRIIHIALLDHPYVRTESFGESEDRKVTIFAK